MAHFRAPNSTLVNAAGYYTYHQHNIPVDDESTFASQSSRSRTQSISSASSASSSSTIARDTPTVIANGAYRNTSSTSSSSRSRVLNGVAGTVSTGRRGVVLDDEDDGDASMLSASTSSTSSSNTILASRPLTTQQQHQHQQNMTSQVDSVSTARPERTQSSAQRPSESEQDNSDRRCWICFGEDTDSEGIWIKPCKCSLVSHEQCLLDWITENQKGSPLKKVHCPQCNTPYYLVEQKSISLALLKLADSLIHATVPYLTFLGLGCSMLITFTTYGAYTVMTLFGAREGERLIGPPVSWTWRTWLGLPVIPAALVLSRSRWADGVLPFAALLFLRATSTNQHGPMQITWPPSPAVTVGVLPWIRLLYNNLFHFAQHQLIFRLLHPQQQQRRSETTMEDDTNPAARQFRQVLERNNVAILGDPAWDERQRQQEHDEDEMHRAEQDPDILLDMRISGSDLGVTVLGALLWPTISSMVGSCLNHCKWIRHYFPESFHRNVLGGCLFVVAKDMASMLYKYERLKQRQSRRVRNYDEIPRDTTR